MSLSTLAHPVVGDRLLTEQEAASMLGLKPATLRTWRSTGRAGQPRWCKIGRACRYRLSDVQAYIADLSDGSEVAA
ncbi:helix-turn-helix domain-containing protein [Brachybacterium sp. MASK1Z-5]|uniref:Helix-turn-helix domain-containing protein n=1 Tax=Brachybacterium halotolerans TaxID=2795215 RepID=A0ABS1BCY3_9MICO|nr:helix-turn-helix domain-containing protein [Brachybacterium halotolerans]MBK0332511.1 helix-turn-helix domain-containing protein [Brachybacterium halotolerans]